MPFTLMSLDEEWILKGIEELLDTRLPQQWLEGFEPDPLATVETTMPKRSAEKRRAKAKAKIHQNRGKNNRRR